MIVNGHALIEKFDTLDNLVDSLTKIVTTYKFS